MLIDFNGIEYHLSIKPATNRAGFDVRIADEAVQRRSVRRRVCAVFGILRVIDAYTGHLPTRDIGTRIRHRLNTAPFDKRLNRAS